jgi:outer membrane receptor for ferric coprogen and ferric-rhodotorulic acid
MTKFHLRQKTSNGLRNAAEFIEHSKVGDQASAAVDQAAEKIKGFSVQAYQVIKNQFDDRVFDVRNWKNKSKVN